MILCLLKGGCTMNTRIKLLRKKLGLTQEEFAQKLGVKRNTVATYEMGRSKPVDAVISLICKTFYVNKDWLINGGDDSDIFTSLPIDEDIDLITKYTDPNSPLGKAYIKLLKVYDNYPEEQKPIVNDFIEKIIEEFEQKK